MAPLLMKDVMKVFALAAVLLVTAGGCKRARHDTPELGYLTFADAARRGELKVAYASLSTKTREALEARTRALVAEVGDAGVRTDGFVALASGSRPQPVTGVKVVEREGESAVTLEITVAEEKKHVRMVKEGERWLVDATVGATGEATP